MQAAGPSGQGAPGQGPMVGDLGYKRLLRMAAHMFYSGECPPRDFVDGELVTAAALEGGGGGGGGQKAKLSKIDTTGLGVVILGHLAKMDGWVDEEALSRQLHVHHKLLRRALKYLEHQQIVAREHLKERSKKKQEALAAATAAAAAALGGAAKQKADQQAADADAPPKLLTFSYCCVDYARFVDSLSLRLHKMRRALRDELDTKEAVATYRCVSCLKDYDSLSAIHVYDPVENKFKCEICGRELQTLLATGEAAKEDDRRARRKLLRSLLERSDAQFKEVHEQIQALRGCDSPHYGTVREWAARENARQEALRRQAEAAAAAAAFRANPLGLPSAAALAAAAAAASTSGASGGAAAAGGATAAPGGVTPLLSGGAGAIGAGGQQRQPPAPQQPQQPQGVVTLPAWMRGSQLQQQQQQQQQGGPSNGGGNDAAYEEYRRQAFLKQYMEQLQGVQQQQQIKAAAWSASAAAAATTAAAAATTAASTDAVAGIKAEETTGGWAAPEAVGSATLAATATAAAAAGGEEDGPAAKRVKSEPQRGEAAVKATVAEDEDEWEEA